MNQPNHDTPPMTSLASTSPDSLPEPVRNMICEVAHALLNHAGLTEEDADDKEPMKMIFALMCGAATAAYHMGHDIAARKIPMPPAPGTPGMHRG